MNNQNDRDNYVVTVNFQTNKEWFHLEPDKIVEMTTSIVDHIDNSRTDNFVVLFPAGWFNFRHNEAQRYYHDLEKQFVEYLKLKNNDICICIGIDGSWGADQIAMAIGRNGIEAVGRKFFPTKYERDEINPAKGYLEYENGKSRIFEMGGTKYYLCVCYDSFGIRKNKLRNPGVDVALDLVHGFHPKGSGDGSGEVYFAKHGFAGTSKMWKCKVFGAATFFDREIPMNWPNGVYWKSGSMSTKEWKYEDNPIKAEAVLPISFDIGKALLKFFKI